MLRDVYKQNMSDGYVSNISNGCDTSEPLTIESEMCRSILLKLLVGIAENLRHAPEALSQLAEDEHVEVRIAVADNVYTAVETLQVLTRDPHADVRYAMAENHNIPTSVLTELTQDDNPYVASRAEKTLNRVASGQILFGEFGARDSMRSYRAAAAH